MLLKMATMKDSYAAVCGSEPNLYGAGRSSLLVIPGAQREPGIDITSYNVARWIWARRLRIAPE
jgi:hypothetical protein